ncbi:MAG: N-acetyl-gamma-glutamyl-phosphate reductase [Rhodobacterales bacterium]|nr:N-acetyl-gamma-glutamyl-phosphate reductase [Rhodobacterales bacterium]
MTCETMDAVVWSASGYVGAEALRLIAQHPRLTLLAAVSRSSAGIPIGQVFPHLTHVYPGVQMVAAEAIAPLVAAGTKPIALISCGPHGHSAALIQDALERLGATGRAVTAIDLSADFRHNQEMFESLYGKHGAQALMAQFSTGLPDLPGPTPTTPHIGHPGCFTTCTVLGAAPLMGLVRPAIQVSAVTGSTGSGKAAKAGTHHPHRQSNFWGYKPLTHRHTPEMEGLLSDLSDTPVHVSFAPHSGPFSRGMAATIFATLTTEIDAAELHQRFVDFYAHTELVQITKGPPKLKDVVGTNHARIGVTVQGTQVVVHSVIDNLLKGAVGGGLQWLNRKAGWPASLGLHIPAVPWI